MIVVFHSDTNNIESGFYLSWISYIQPDTYGKNAVTMLNVSFLFLVGSYVTMVSLA